MNFNSGDRDYVYIFLAVTLLALPLLLIFSSYVRRLHDSNLSGWWALLLPLTFVGGGIFTLIAAITLGCRKSTPGANRFGDAGLVEF